MSIIADYCSYVIKRLNYTRFAITNIKKNRASLGKFGNCLSVKNRIFLTFTKGVYPLFTGIMLQPKFLKDWCSSPAGSFQKISICHCWAVTSGKDLTYLSNSLSQMNGE